MAVRIGDLVKTCLEPRKHPLVEFNDECGCFFIEICPGGGYEISLSRCNTPEKVLAWMLHLSHKKWCTAEVLKDFLLCAEEQVEINREF